MADNQVVSYENDVMIAAFLSSMGDRENQEDSFGCRVGSDNKSIYIICDGMGGFEGGECASKTAVEYFLKAFDLGQFNEAVVEALERVTREADAVVSVIKNENNEHISSGTTLVSVLLDNYDMYWSSVGDSRLYLKRNSDLVQITVDHNYKEYLMEKFKTGEISQVEYVTEMNGPKAEALLSYLGLNGLPLINRNLSSFRLMKGDLIIIMSDGLYKIIDNDTISKILDNFSNPQEAVLALEKKVSKIARKSKIDRDNSTVGLIRIK